MASVACDCPKNHLTSTIDNAYLSLSESASLHVLEDALSDQYPILVNLDIRVESKENTRTKTIYRRDLFVCLLQGYDFRHLPDQSNRYLQSSPKS